MIGPSLKALSRIHGYAIFKTFLDRSQWWSADQREAWVKKALEQTLVGALAVPFYRERFAALGFDPRVDVTGTQVLAKLPILARQEVQAQGARLYAQRVPGTYLVAHTSGTMGSPLSLRLSESFVAFDSACVFRHWSWAGYELRDPIVALRSYVPERPGHALWRYSRAQNTLFMSAYHLTPATCEQYIARVLQFRPRLIRGYPSTLAMFADYAYSRRGELSFVTGVFTSSETLLDHERATIERTFGPKVFNWYGMTEPALVLTECERGAGLHVNWEYGHGELLPSDELAPDEYRLVTTGYHNPLMPLIRYETGDVVRVHGTAPRCDCGRTLPLLHSVSGRKDECLYTPEGRRLPSVNFYTLFRAYDAVLRFQIVQYGQREIVVRVAPRANRRLDRATLDGIRDAMQARVGVEVSVAIEVTDRFVTNSDGKSPPIVRRPGTRAAEETVAYAVSTQTGWVKHQDGQVVHKLDCNEADRVPSRRVREALIELLERDETICWYPDACAQELVRAIATYVEVEPEHVLPVAGGDAGIELVASALVHPGDAVLVVSPAYDRFRATLEQRGARVIAFDHDGRAPLDIGALERTARASSVRAVYLCNPNNPLGYVVEPALLERALALCRKLGSLLVVDEAYVELGGCSVARRVRDRDSPVLVLRTFSKAFGLAGLRIGYVLAAGDVMQALRKLHNPKSVTTLAMAAALAALRDLPAMHAYVDEVRCGRERVTRLLVRHGACAYPSAGNFVLFEWPEAARLIAYLAEHGIAVRDRTASTGGRPSVRVTIGSSRSVDVLATALERYFATASAPTGS